MHKRGNYYGALLSLVMFTMLLALFFGVEPETTGLVVSEKIIKQAKVETTPGATCFGGVFHGSCTYPEPLYCEDGEFVYNCYECGCQEGEHCTELGVCEPIQHCADGSVYGDCSFLKGWYCEDGTLISNCGLCGCEEGYFCQDSKCVLN